MVSLDQLYAHLNKRLFNGRLPTNVPVEYVESLRGSNTDANLHSEFSSAGNRYNIELNPDIHHGEVKRKTAKSLAHEMVHLRLYEGGMSISENSSHGKRFISAMRDVGIIYTAPGEKEKIIPDGPMDRACSELGLVKKHDGERYDRHDAFDERSHYTPRSTSMRRRPLMCLWNPEAECETQDVNMCRCRQEAKREARREERRAERLQPARQAPPVYREPPVLQSQPAPRGGYEMPEGPQFRGLRSWGRK